MVTGGADREGFKPRNTQSWNRPTVSQHRQATPERASRRVRGGGPGSKAASSLTLRLRVNRGDPSVGVAERRTRRQAINREGAGIGRRKSEVSIVALKPGNAGGAKGHRFGELVRGNIA